MASDLIPSLASLRRGRAKGGFTATPSLFDPPPRLDFQESEPREVSNPDVPRVWSVAALVKSIRTVVESRYGQITVEGEVSNWRPSTSGHCYFTLKDGDAQLTTVMFRRQSALLRFQPKDGDAVRVKGQLSVYESRGQMQLIAQSMEQVGLGALLAATRQLKERLRSEGLFDRKRELPPFPRCIGVVTSAQGAALRDIAKVCRRRHAAVRLLVYPAAVQGPGCAAEVAAGVLWFSAHANRADVVIVARGGGSWEDLHGFDAEIVARAIASSEVPVVTGIGHATDSTIADAAADVCAPTPSAAAELVTAGHFGLQDRVHRLRTRLRRAAQYEMLQARQRLADLSAETVLRQVLDGLRQREQRLDDLDYSAESSARRSVQARSERLRKLQASMQQQRVDIRLANARQQLQVLQGRLIAGRASAWLKRRTRLEQASTHLQALSPMRVLERGYSLVYDAKGNLLRDASDVRIGDEVVARLANGRVASSVTSTLA